MMSRAIYIIYIAVLAFLCDVGVCAGTAAPPGDNDVAGQMLRAGETAYAERQYSSAMKSYLDALRITEHGGNPVLTARIYNGIGNLYSTQGDFQMGLYFYRKALALSRHGGDRHFQNAILNNLVGTSCFVGQADSGMVYLRQMEANAEPQSDYRYNILMGRGLIAKSRNNPKLSAYYYVMARQYAADSRMDSSYIDNSNSCLAQLYMDTGRPDSAIMLLRKNEAWARRTSQEDLLAETLRLLAEAYDAKGATALATSCRMKYVGIVDRLHHSDEFNAMKNAQFMYDATKNAHTISLLTQQQLFSEQQIEMQNRWLVTLAVGLAAIIVLFVVVYMQKRQLRHAYNRLYDRSQLYLSAPMAAVSDVRPVSSASAAAVSGDAGQPLPSSILSDEQRDRLLADIARVMESPEEFCRSDFSIDRLAQLVGSNSRYVSEAINDGYGKNFRTFLNEYRIKEAMTRLADSERFGGYTIKAISESVGYKSQANFIAVFTKLTGMKPSIYQKISKERICIDK